MTPALPGDLAPGDVIALPGKEGEVVVEAINLGRGGFPLTVFALHAGSGESCRYPAAAMPRGLFPVRADFPGVRRPCGSWRLIIRPVRCAARLWA